MEIAKLFLQLGVAGAALFLLYHLINKMFKYLELRTSSDSKSANKIDKLCDNIAELVKAFYDNTHASTTLGIAVQTQYDALNNKFDSMDQRFQKTMSDMFANLREHEKHSHDRLQDMESHLSAGLDGLEIKVENLKNNCQTWQRNEIMKG